MTSAPQNIHPAANIQTEQGRLDTFRCWPRSAAVEPCGLARAGFFYLGHADRVCCAFCGGTMKNWQHDDDPWLEHERHFKNCPFILGQDVGNIPIVSELGLLRENMQSGCDELSSESAVVCLEPCHPDFQTLGSRMNSFVGWPDTVVQTPELLVDAGFFYIGNGDCVRCFCCDGALRNWDADDDPWVEHARWFPRCPYLIQQKGQGFVNRIQNRFSDKRPMRVSPFSSPSRRLSEAMQSATVKEVLLMGFRRDLVENVLQQLLITSDGQIPQLQEIVNCLLGDDDISQTPQGNPQVTGTTTPSRGLLPDPYIHREGNPSRLLPTSQRNELLEDRILCKICMDREVEVTFLPCGHLVCCSDCARNVQECPMCRKIVRANIRTYLC